MGRFLFCRWDESLAGTYIPKNILQPIIENSIYTAFVPKLIQEISVWRLTGGRKMLRLLLQMMALEWIMRDWKLV